MKKDFLHLQDGQPIDFILENESRVKILKLTASSSVVAGIIDLAKRLNLQYFSCVDLFGDTIFNGLQIKELVQECLVLREKTSDQNLKIILEEVEKICHEGLKSPHRYLKIIGN